MKAMQNTKPRVAKKIMKKVDTVFNVSWKLGCDAYRITTLHVFVVSVEYYSIVAYSIVV